jgi:uncharacterized repeat protein (TIGR02543 family)
MFEADKSKSVLRTFPGETTFGYKAWYTNSGNKQNVTVELHNIPETYVNTPLYVTAKPQILTYRITYGNLLGATNPNSALTGYTIETPTITFELLTENLPAGQEFDRWSITSIPKGSTGDKTVNAVWKTKTYTVNFNTNGGGAIGALTGVEHGSTISEPTPPNKVGHTFAGWFKEETLENEWDFGVDTVTANVVLYAKYNINSYTISFVTEAGSTVVSTHDPFTFDYGTDVSANLPTPTRTDNDPAKYFVGWYIDSMFNSAFDGIVPAEDITLYAKWGALQQYMVTFNTDGGSLIDSQSVLAGQVVTRPNNPTKTGYTFDGWYISDELTTEFDFNTKIHSATTIYAKFVINQRILAFNLAGGTWTEDNFTASRTIDFGTTIIRPADPTRDGFNFDDWYTSSNGTTKYIFGGTMPDHNVIIYAKWTLNVGGLQDTIAAVQTVLDQNGDYLTDTSKSNLQDVLNRANAVLENPNSTPGEVKAALENLDDRMSELRLSPDRLKDLLDKPVYSTMYTTQSYNDYVTMRNTVADFVNDPANFAYTTQNLESIKNHEANLTAAIQFLVPKWSFENEEDEKNFYDLQDQIKDIIDDILKDKEGNDLNPNDFTPDSWDEYMKAYNKIMSLLEDSNAEIEELRGALCELQAAKSNLTPVQHENRNLMIPLYLGMATAATAIIVGLIVIALVGKKKERANKSL